MSESIAARPRYPFAVVLRSMRRWWREAVVNTVDQTEVIEKRREECQISARYIFMLAMSAGIAILGLLLSSPAVVIGAMLLSPLMGPIIGLGFALATGDFNWVRQAGRSLVAGTLVAVLLCALVVLCSPLQTVTPEIAARTRPNLFDLLVALFSALAGAYAMIRGREGTVVGVAIATALMPPLAVVGFGLATLNWTVFSGALLLYFTNLMTIAFTAAVMARFYGFRTSLSDRQTQLQALLIVVAFVALAVPLAFSLRQIAWEANASRQTRGTVMDSFDNRARLSQLDIDFDTLPIRVTATVLTPELEPQAEEVGERALARELGRQVQFSLTQYQVGTSSSAAEAAQLSSARAQEEQTNLRRAEELAERLALVAGVPEDEVLIDRQRRRALVRAKELDGASLAAYFALEQRIAATEPEWRVELLPPARPLPDVTFDEGGNDEESRPDAEGIAALKLIIWAAKRVDMPVTLTGPQEQRDVVREALLAQDVRVAEGEDGRTPLKVRWQRPDGGE
ncbi:TIGR00341 family protein [Altericroceibacterium endophyticum]|uniref:TIGR00341 family protein n=1 Tax=Altericroceibacterium endophyticum TaxID=1808508 RepID=A0A6I4T389_9SPHN|nr:TIGR00341 family protein [Altericroceibacterium endophyticum]MXO65268.1 TIGR00341 family protein [Altericroceibacterium endophyticum]